MAMRIRRDAYFFTCDTEVLPDETYSLMDQCRERYGVIVHRSFPDPDDLGKDPRTKQPNARHFEATPGLRLRCCDARKVRPLARALMGRAAWVTGQRYDPHEESRSAIRIFERDDLHGGILKINPVAHWPDKRIWDYVQRHKVPYNRLYDQGYLSIGCGPCTRKVESGGSRRSGRWWWEDGPKECGIHVKLEAL